jgi:hypothetical protein
MVNLVPVYEWQRLLRYGPPGTICLLMKIVLGIIDETIVATAIFIILEGNSKNNLNKSVLEISHGKY